MLNLNLWSSDQLIMKNKFNAIVIAGPTGVGKTSLSIKLAKALKGEIISADSAQVFKELNIGTAKITPEEMLGVPHHLIDILPPVKKYSVGDFQKDSEKVLKELEDKGIFPIVVGGTGLYLDSITEGLSKLPPADKELREQLSKKSTEELYSQLSDLDGEAAKNIHPNNRVKIERALEVCILSKDKFSSLSKQNIKNNNFSFLKVALERDRDYLYSRINERVDIMVTSGLIEEVTSLYKKYGESLKQLNIIGYSEIISHLDGSITLDEAINKIKQNSRNYAKRQFTWFKNSKGYVWYDLDKISESEIIDDILNKL